MLGLFKLHESKFTNNKYIFLKTMLVRKSLKLNAVTNVLYKRIITKYKF